MGMVGLSCQCKLSLSNSLIYWYTVSLVRWTQYSYVYKHSETLELIENHDKHVLQLMVN